MLGPKIDDRDVLALDKAGVLQSLAKCAQKVRVEVRRRRTEHPDHRHRWLLCARGERPREGRAAEKRDERAASHSITSSARASSIGGTVRPMALAVVTLMTSSTLVGNSIGRSLGSSPFRILSTK